MEHLAIKGMKNIFLYFMENIKYPTNVANMSSIIDNKLLIKFNYILIIILFDNQ